LKFQSCWRRIPSDFNKPSFKIYSLARKEKSKMKRFLVITLLTLITPLVVSAQTTMFKFNQDGEFASLNQSSDFGSSISLSVSRNFSTGTATTASLSYVSFSLSADTNTLTVV
jgi:Trk-type K+ transport system membrane component